MINLLASACFLASLFSCKASIPGYYTDHKSDPTVSTEAGLVRGLRYRTPELPYNGFAFLGIPFAKPPVGWRRFLYPEPVDPWPGFFEADRLPNSCIQTPDHFFGTEFRGSNMWNPDPGSVSEDCLYLNVWVPSTAAAASSWKPWLTKLPVMVWIFGGAYSSGTTSLDLYDGRLLASLNNVVVVSIGYRLGAFGFLCLDDPAAAPCNVGLFDQLMALTWVQSNILQFGGDPTNVTLFGESSGAASASLHLFSRLSHDKFQRCILQSGAATMPWAVTSLAEGRRRSVELAVSYLDCDGSENDVRRLADCLRSADAHDLVERQWVSRGVLQFPFLPVVDGHFLAEDPIVSLRHGRFKRCPILLGSNRNEGSWFIVYELSDHLSLERKSTSRDQFVSSLRRLFFYYPQYGSSPPNSSSSAVVFDAIAYRYTDWTDANDTDSNTAALESAVGDAFFVCPLNEFARSYAAAGLPVFSYLFGHRYESNPWPHWMGVLHGDEIPFVFGHVFKSRQLYTATDRRLSQMMMRYWTNFARTG